MVQDAGIEPWFEMAGDRVVAFRRQSKQGGSLVFLLNVEDKTAKARVQPRWGISAARDLLDDRELALSAGGFEVEMALGQVCVVHCTDA
jgi:hypothetical protein